MLRLALRAAFSTPPPLQPPLFLVVESKDGPMRVLGKAADLATAKRVLRARVRELCGDEAVLRFLFRCFVISSAAAHEEWPDLNYEFASYQRKDVGEQLWEGFDGAVAALNAGAVGGGGPL